MNSSPTIRPVANISLLLTALLLSLTPLGTCGEQHSVVPLALAAESGPQSIMLELNPNENINRKKPPLVYQIRPTRSVEDVLTIRNFSRDTAYAVKVYAVDSLQGGNGSIAFQLENRPRNNIGQWVKFDQQLFTVEAGSTVFAPYRIEIPENTAPGTFQGGLVAEILPAEALATLSSPAGNLNTAQSQVRIVPRLIEPLLISIPGRKNLNYSLDDFSIHQRDGKPCFHLVFSNRSNILLFGQAKLSIAGTMLADPYVMAVNDLTVLQNESLDRAMHFTNPPLWGGYRATLELEVYEFNAATGQMVLLDTLTRQLEFSIVPWPCIIAFLLLIIVLIVAEHYRRRYLRARLSETFTHRVNKGETLLSIADTYRLNWKTVAKLNKLKKPYTISPGDTLNLPFPKEKAPVTTTKENSPVKRNRAPSKHSH